jgi:hypothetical protein
MYEKIAVRGQAKKNKTKTNKKQNKTKQKQKQKTKKTKFGTIVCLLVRTMDLHIMATCP